MMQVRNPPSGCKLVNLRQMTWLRQLDSVIHSKKLSWQGTFAFEDSSQLGGVRLAAQPVEKSNSQRRTVKA